MKQEKVIKNIPTQSKERMLQRAKRRKVTKLAFRALGAALMIAILVSLFQIVHAAYSGVKTEGAVSYTAFDTVTCPALAFRHETIVSGSDEGVLYYRVENGQRVAAGGTIADRYSGSEEVDRVLQIAQYEKKISELELLRNNASEHVPDLDLLDSQISAELQALLSYSNGQNINDLLELRDELLLSLNKKQVVTGKVSNFDDAISVLKAKKEEVETQNVKPLSQISSPVAGFFADDADGYESVYTMEALEKLTVSSFEELSQKKASPPQATIGKVVTDYVWYLACQITEEDAKLFSEGQTAVLSVPLTVVQDVDCTVERIVRDSEKKSAVIVMKVTSISAGMIDLRKETVQLKTNVYTGLQVRNSAIRVVDGEKGVYILSGVEAKFVKIEILFSTVDYALCKPGTGNRELCLYDEIIVEGTNLYDGKVVD